MIRLQGREAAVLKDVFKNTTDTSVYCVCQGHMGEAWADEAEAPHCGQLILGDFVFFDGDASHPVAKELVAHLPEDKPFDEWYLVGSGEQWYALIEEVWGERAKAFDRYAIKKDTDIFDREKLRKFGETVPEGYTIRRIDGELYDQAMGESWSWDACIQFEDKEDFLKRGLGFAAVHEDQLVATASSYSIFDKGLDITIATRKDHRRKGLAKAAVSTLILACLDRGWYPNWDARTMISVGLAEQLGYHFDRAYRTYSIEVQR